LLTISSASAALSGQLQIPQLVTFREGWYSCLGRRADALFELSDALLCADGPVASFPHLSLEPEFRRGWGSGYAALAKGQVDMEAMRDLLAAHRPSDWPMVFAVDASTMERCDAETSPDRGFYYHASKHSAGQPIVAGWSYQWITQLNWAKDSWTAPMDARRLHPHEDSVQATVTQVRDLVRRLGGSVPVPLFVFDAGYDPIALSHELRDGRLAVLVRIKGDRVFYADPPERKAGSIGRPRRHGKRFDCKQAASRPVPDRELVSADQQYGKVVVQAWSGLHPKLNTRGHWAGFDEPPIVSGTVIRVQVERLPGPAGRALKTLWLWWSGPGEPDLDLCWRAYIRRFDIEHTIRFSKNTLGWITPSLRHPEQADRWTMVILAALTQLRLARPLVADRRMPWERPRDQDRLTPTRVRRGFRCIRATFPLVASPPKPCGVGPGRPRGAYSGPAPRHPAIKKAA
jgi:hypothetical protein